MIFLPICIFYFILVVHFLAFMIWKQNKINQVLFHHVLFYFLKLLQKLQNKQPQELYQLVSLWLVSSIKAPFRLRNKLLGLQHFASMFDQEIRNYKRNRQMCLPQLTISACVPNPADMHPLIIFIGQLDTTALQNGFYLRNSFILLNCLCNGYL